MLRWLAVFAVILNIIYFAVNYSAESPAAVVSSVIAQSSPALQMLSERQSAAINDVAAEQKEKLVDKKPVESLLRPAADDVPAPNDSLATQTADTEVAVDGIEKAIETDSPVSTTSSEIIPSSTAVTESCWEIGKFSGEDHAKRAQQRLAVLGYMLQLQKRSVQGEPDYWVFLGPYDNRRQALAAHRDLQARNIDSFLINEGELENAVSLGLFSLESGAQKMQQQSKKQGLDAQLRAVPRLRNEWWGVMRYPDAQLPDAVREKIILDQSDPPLEIKALACESIANMQKLD